MYGIDLFLITATMATLFWMIATVFLQHKIILYTLLAGKHAFRVHVAFISIVALQQLALTVLDYKSRWMFTTVLWPLGALIFAASLMLLAGALYESGPGVLVCAQVFGYKKPHRGKLWKRYKQPLALGFGGAYLGLALLTGHIAYLLVAILLAAGLCLVSFATRVILR